MRIKTKATKNFVGLIRRDTHTKQTYRWTVEKRRRYHVRKRMITTDYYCTHILQHWDCLSNGEVRVCDLDLRCPKENHEKQGTLRPFCIHQSRIRDTNGVIWEVEFSLGERLHSNASVLNKYSLKIPTRCVKFTFI